MTFGIVNNIMLSMHFQEKLKLEIYLKYEGKKLQCLVYCFRWLPCFIAMYNINISKTCKQELKDKAEFRQKWQIDSSKPNSIVKKSLFDAQPTITIPNMLIS